MIAVLFLTAVSWALLAQSGAPPPMKSVGVKGAAETSGYSAPAAAKSRSELVELLVDIRHCQPAPAAFDGGVRALAEGNPETASQTFKAGLQQAPENEFLVLGLVVAIHEKGQVTDAVSSLLMIAETSPERSSAYLLLAEILTLPSYSPSTDVENRLKTLAARRGAPAAAHLAYACSLPHGSAAVLTELKLALAQDPNLAAAHRLLGSVASERGEYPDAIREYRTALILHPSWTEIHYKLAQAYIRAGEKALAEQEFASHQKAKSTPPSTAPCAK